MNKETDLKRFAEIMTATSEVYGKPISQIGIDMWFGDLRKYDIRQIYRAFQAHRQDPKNGKFMPKPSDIIRHIDGLPDELAVNAWAKVIEAIRRVGSWGSVEFDDMAIHQVVTQMGGWSKLCSMSLDELSFKQRDFERMYLDAKKSPSEFTPRYLAGVAEIENFSKGLPCDPPVRIGVFNNLLTDTTVDKPTVNLIESKG